MKRINLHLMAIASLVFVIGLSSCAQKSNDDFAQGPSGSINGHDWVDMGTSVKWATTNIGTSKSKGLGDYFAWGEVSPAPDGNYNDSNCRLYGNSAIDSIAGDANYDAARANWGSTWRLPTDTEWLELMNKCDWEWYGSGYKITAGNGNVLYLPAAGYQIGSWRSDVGRIGSYWCATPLGRAEWASRAYNLYFASGGLINVSNSDRSTGHSVRPVSE